MLRKYFGTDGVRGKVGEFPITPDFALKLGYAAGKVLSRLGTRKVIIGKDTRVSGYMLESALEAGFSAAGVNAILTGPLPTPAVAYLTKTFRAEAGVVISASHNPYWDNGIKFFSHTGEKLPDEVELAIEAELENDIACVASEKLGRASRMTDAAGRYIEFCKSTFPSTMSLDGLKLVVDCAHGAAYQIAPAVFRELGAEVITIGNTPDGVNINQGCGATAPQALAARVVAEQAHAGIALDGDADRIIMVDHSGRIVDGDELLFILARAAQAEGRLQGGVVGTQMSNLGLELALEALGIPFLRAKVGDRYVMEQLLAQQWLLGGENSGHIICRDKVTTGDAIVAALQVLAVMMRELRSLAELCAGMTLLPQTLVNIRFSGQADPLSSPQVLSKVADVERELAGQGRVLLRKSGTEPLLRVMVEGRCAETIERCAQQIADVVRVTTNETLL
jgi:phosphoglucosamine mutase